MRHDSALTETIGAAHIAIANQAPVMPMRAGPDSKDSIPHCRGSFAEVEIRID